MDRLEEIENIKRLSEINEQHMIDFSNLYRNEIDDMIDIREKLTELLNCLVFNLEVS